MTERMVVPLDRLTVLPDTINAVPSTGRL